jgi:carbon monoxide dehydrogenase subunit G
MELAHEFTVNTPIDRAWAVLTDVERIAPCMPGAELTEVDGDTYHGLVKVKVGPITAQYKGTASFVEKDGAAHRAVLKAAGRDARGQGNASATVTAVMTEQGDGTRVAITTNMTVSGRVAQFGRGVMADVTAKLLQQFVDNLEADVLAPAGKGGPASAGDAAGAAGAGPAADAAGAAGAGPGPDAAGASGAGPAASASGAGPAAAAADAGPAADAARAAGAGPTAGVSGAGPTAGAAGAGPAGAGPAAATAVAGPPSHQRTEGESAKTEGEPVRVVGLVLRSVARRTGQFFVRLFHRLTGRHEG